MKNTAETLGVIPCAGATASSLHQNLDVVLAQLTTVSAEMRQSFGAAVVARPCSLENLTRQVRGASHWGRRWLSLHVM